MTVSVGDLLDTPHLRSRLLAGTSALSRAVTWAHSCELSAPWEWLGEGDLLMTTGLGIPTSARDQVAYVERCANAGIAGVAIGEKMSAPPLTPAMLRAAEEHRFAVIETGYEVPFVALARVVAQSNQAESQELLRRTMHIYEMLRLRTMAPGPDVAIVEDLAGILGCRLSLVDTSTGRGLLEGGELLPEGLKEQTVAVRRSRGDRPPAMLPAPDGSALILAVPGFGGAALVASGWRAAHRPEPVLLHHASTIAAFVLTRRNADRERERRLGATLLAQLVDGRTDLEASAPALAERGLSRANLVVAAVTLRADGPEVHHALGDEGIGHLVLVRDDLVLVAIPDSEAAVATLRTAAERIGLSEPVSEQRQVPGAAREARFALSEAVTRRQAVARHGEGQLLPPRSAGEAEAIVRNVLTPLLEYDAAHDARLTHSLRVFLEENRSWQRAAARLHIHKQTLVYRMGRVAELSGRALDTTHGVAELWLALEAYEATRIPGQGH